MAETPDRGEMERLKAENRLLREAMAELLLNLDDGVSGLSRAIRRARDLTE